jgi:hypothetical protein
MDATYQQILEMVRPLIHSIVEQGAEIIEDGIGFHLWYDSKWLERTQGSINEQALGGIE